MNILSLYFTISIVLRPLQKNPFDILRILVFPLGRGIPADSGL